MLPAVAEPASGPLFLRYPRLMDSSSMNSKQTTPGLVSHSLIRTLLANSNRVYSVLLYPWPNLELSLGKQDLFPGRLRGELVPIITVINGGYLQYLARCVQIVVTN